jgi:hypothetical protein
LTFAAAAPSVSAAAAATVAADPGYLSRPAVAAIMAAELAAAGGILTADDFTAAAPAVREPLKVQVCKKNPDQNTTCTQELGLQRFFFCKLGVAGFLKGIWVVCKVFTSCHYGRPSTQSLLLLQSRFITALCEGCGA